MRSVEKQFLPISPSYDLAMVPHSLFNESAFTILPSISYGPMSSETANLSHLSYPFQQSLHGFENLSTGDISNVTLHALIVFILHDVVV